MAAFDEPVIFKFELTSVAPALALGWQAEYIAAIVNAEAIFNLDNFIITTPFVRHSSGDVLS